MLKLLRRLCSALRRRRSKPSALLIKTYLKPIDHNNPETDANGSSPTASVLPRRSVSESDHSAVVIRVATFNAALFSMAPAVTKTEPPTTTKATNFARPRGILKPPKQKPRPKPTIRVSINLPENEISLLRNTKSRRQGGTEENDESNLLGRLAGMMSSDVWKGDAENEKLGRNTKAVAEVLRGLNVDILALQEAKAVEENEMRPLSDLAEALGLNYYVFAESWAPQYGNAVLSRWPIKKSHVQKLLDNSDFRNVLRATIDVPGAGEVSLYCTHLDHLDEEWRMKQISTVSGVNGEPHLLAGGLNSLCETDYSTERWTDIVKYYQEMGKPRPKADVMRFVKSMQYVDAKDFAGECEPVVIIAKGQSVQGTCKYGTRVDYLLASPTFPFEFVPGSYSVYSSLGTSDHHIVKADLVKRKNIKCPPPRNTTNIPNRLGQNVVRITDQSSCKGIWSMPIK